MIDDFQTDRSLRLVAKFLAGGRSIPDFVKTASLDEFDDCQGRNGYALPHWKRLPCHSKTACYLSHLYFALQRDKLPGYERQLAESKLAKFAELHEITDEVAGIPAMVHKEKDSTVMDVAAKVASNVDRLPISDVIILARELKADGVKTAAADYLSGWAFDDHFVDLPYSIAVLKANYGQPEMLQGLRESRRRAKLAYYGKDGYDAMTPRQLHEHVPMLLELTADTLPDLPRDLLRMKFAEFQTYPEHVVQLADGSIYPESKVIRKLAKWDRAFDLGLVEGPLKRPVDGWQDKLESLPVDQARKLRYL
ncbi:MAG: hypothetical protein KatS3mg109_0172 [Pirellulaceae bacterium]|nr:MAG: hypothetical protein KatS3mg109_0172 [Pirellulaceae bacterium]